MGFLTKYGSAWGAIPMTGGSVFWVAPSASYQVDGKAFNASDGNDGLSPERAFVTLSAAVAAATANAGDVICLLPGTHTTASALAVSKAGLTFIGLPYMPGDDVAFGAVVPKATITGTGAIGVAVTAADVSFHNIRFLPVTQFAAMTFTTAADRLLVKGCYIDLRTATAHANTKGITATGATQAPRHVVFRGNYIEQANAGTSNGVAVDLGAAKDFLFEKNLIVNDGTVGSAVAWAAAVTLNDNISGVIRDNDVVATESSVPITKVFIGAALTGAGVVNAYRNTMSVNTGGLLFDDFAAADMGIANNYVATVAGGTGGTLIVATT